MDVNTNGFIVCNVHWQPYPASYSESRGVEVQFAAVPHRENNYWYLVFPTKDC